MTISPDTKPRLPSHYYVLYDPPDQEGDEALIFISERRKVKVKGTLFREFQRTVLPLLDGQHTVSEIEALAEDVFLPGELTSALRLLAAQHLLTEDTGAGHLGPEVLEPLTPQLNFLHELTQQPDAVQQRLANATVCLIGLGGPGSLVAAGLAACGLGHLRLIDNSHVGVTDGYFDPIYLHADRDRSRARTLQGVMEGRWPHMRVELDERALESEERIVDAAAGSDLVVCCADKAEAALLYKLNRAGMKTRIPWISCAVSGFEVVVGPAVRPHDTPCYLCYTMRSVACADEPEDDFAFQRFLDNRKHDDSGRRENLVFAAGLAANLIGLESLKLLTGIAPCATLGSVVVVKVLDLSMKKHVVLRHPNCPVCFAKSAPEATASAELAGTAAGA